MSLETRVDKLEAHHRNLDKEVHGLARVCADIKNIALTNQHDIADLKADISALTEAMYAGFKRTDEKFAEHDARFDRLETRFDGLEKRFDGLEKRFDGLETRFDQLELLIRQSLPKN